MEKINLSPMRIAKNLSNYILNGYSILRYLYIFLIFPCALAFHFCTGDFIWERKKITPHYHIRKFEILHFSENISKITSIVFRGFQIFICDFCSFLWKSQLHRTIIRQVVNKKIRLTLYFWASFFAVWELRLRHGLNFVPSC